MPLAPFGARMLHVAIEAEAIIPPDRPAPEPESAVIERALNHPIGCGPLGSMVKRGETVVILVNDITRLARTELMLPPILDTLNGAGIPDADISIVFALGTHRGQTAAEQRRIVGEEVFDRIPVYDHDGADDASLVEVGATSFGNRVEISRRVLEADRIVLTGEIVFHQIAGYSGGRKSLVPGVAGNRTTAFNHRMILDPRCRAGLLEGNPAHEDLLEGCRMVGPDFLLNVIPGARGEILDAVAGHFEHAHREGCRAADRLLRTRIECPFDMVIASSGGAPLDIDLRQAHKGMENACAALRPGGSLFYYAACGEGLGSPMLAHYLNSYASEGEIESALRQNFVVGGHKALWLARLGARYDVHLVSCLDPALVSRCGFQPVRPEAHAGALRELLERKAPARIGWMPYAGCTVPALTQ